jgi:hypothetical protein
MVDVTAHLGKLLPEARIGVSDKRIPNIANKNCENLMKDLEFKPRYTMESGLTEYVNAVRNRRPRASQSLKQNGRRATLARFLLDVVVALAAARQHIGERLRWQAHQPYHVGRIWEAVCVLIVSCPQDIVRTNILGQILERSFDQFERG